MELSVNFNSFFIFVACVLILVRSKHSLAEYLFDGIFFPMFTDETVKEYSIAAKQAKNLDNQPKMKVSVSYILKENVSKLPLFGTVNVLIAIIISTIVSVSVPCIFRLDTINDSIYLSIVSIIIILYFGASTASNSHLNRKVGLIFALVFAIIFDICLTYFELGPFDIRPIFLSYFSLPKWLINIVASFIAAYIAYSFYYPCLKFHQIYIAFTSPNRNIITWGICTQQYEVYGYFSRQVYNFIHRLNPFLTLVFLVSRWYAVEYPHMDLYADIAYLSLQLLISIFLILKTKSGLKIILNDPYKYLTEFDQTRKFEHGKRFQNALNRALELLPTYAVALLSYPVLIILCCFIYGVSYLMSGPAQEFARVLPLFVVGVSDFVIACSKISGSFGV